MLQHHSLCLVRTSPLLCSRDDDEDETRLDGFVQSSASPGHYESLLIRDVDSDDESRLGDDLIPG